MNYCFIIGNLVKAPEAKQTPSGVSVTTFTIAVARRFDSEKTDFFNVVTWRGLADNCARYLVKGQKVAVTGELQTRSYEGNDGVKRYITEISADNVEFLNKPRTEGTRAEDTNKPEYQGGLFAHEDVLDDEELPF